MADDDIETVVRPAASSTLKDEPPKSPVMSAIEEASSRFGLSPSFMKSVASIESDMKPESNRGRITQYKGLYQIGQEEWARWGSGDIYNARDNAMAAGRMLASHKREFAQNFGRDPSDAELYMVHQQGMGFHTRGAMTNIAGNPYPGMRGPQSSASFMSGWGAEVAKRKERFGGNDTGVEDMTEHYNTPLNASEKPQFKAWAKAQSALVGRDVEKDKFDYDIQGAWKSNPGYDMRGHGFERFKKPNHPTFSSESIYSHRGGLQGGEWFMSDNQWHFAPSEHNLMFHGWEGLHSYFGSGAEKGSALAGDTMAHIIQQSIAEEGAHFTAGDIGPHSKNIEHRKEPPISREQAEAVNRAAAERPYRLTVQTEQERGLLGRQLGTNEEIVQTRKRIGIMTEARKPKSRFKDMGIR